jgi:arylsulfatase A-like enzyme
MSRLSVMSVVVLILLAVPRVQAEEDNRPNIILIMSDDMGYSDIGCYGGEIQTPNLDQLAAEGLRFTQFYNTGRCCPTRGALLSGLYSHQSGIGWMMNDRGYDGYRGDLNRTCVTIAEAMRPAGYRTYMTGKWHVTKYIQPEGPKDNWPRQRGFDRFYGTITGAGSFFDPGTLTRDNTMISPITDKQYQPDEYYYTDAISDHAVRYIDDHAADHADKPFFMYVAYTAAHWPMHALPQDIAKYKGHYDGGYGPIREAREWKMKKLGLIEPKLELAPQVGDWNKVENKQWEVDCMEVYAAMIDNMDQGVGRIVGALEKNGQLDNTLIMFFQDNGGCQEGVGRRGDFTRPVPPSLPTIADDAIRIDVIPKQNRAGVPTLQGPGIVPGPEDTYIAYGINWANVSNTPFREYKHFVHEGGIASPLIAHWPKGIKRSGKLDSQPAHLIDMMATCVDLGKVDYPTEVNGKKITPMEGVSLAPALAGRSLDRQDPIFWEHEGNRAVRDGQWKLVAKENKPWELYDMSRDRSELNDLAREMPERVEQLSASWDAWAGRAMVLPLGAWRGKVSFNRKQKRFELQAGANLGQAAAPYVVKKQIAIVVVLEKPGSQGVIVAQGGTAHGYSLYLHEGLLEFATRHSGKLTVLTASQPLADETVKVIVQLASDGSVRVTAGAALVIEGKVPGMMVTMPQDGLQVGRDINGAVGRYTAPAPFDGTIKSVVIEVAK